MQAQLTPLGASSRFTEASSGDHRPLEEGKGWEAELSLKFSRRGERSVLGERRQMGPLLVQRPFYPEGDEVCHTYLLHPPGGIVGGDRLRLELSVEQNAHALLTNPGATRWYFSPNRTACSEQRARLGKGATLEWLPQESLVFNGARAKFATRIDLAGDSRLMGWEILGLGRPACGEKFQDGSLDFRMEISRDGRPLFLERQRSEQGLLPGLRGYAACATFAAAPADDAVLERARRLLEDHSQVLAGATRIEDLVVVRALAAHCEPLKNCFVGLWSGLRPLVVGLEAEPPRIWKT
jgi:urease accessory protein